MATVPKDPIMDKVENDATRLCERLGGDDLERVAMAYATGFYVGLYLMVHAPSAAIHAFNRLDREPTPLATQHLLGALGVWAQSWRETTNAHE